jgi:hypothetical protein
LLQQARPLLAPLVDRLSIVMCEGLLITGYLAAGRLAEAQAVGAELAPKLEGAVLPLAPCLHGYVGAAQVALASWDQAGAGDRRARQAARAAARRLRRFAGMFPMARPAALSIRAAVARREGHAARAAGYARRALAEAQALGMSSDAALTTLA